jgi:hypothetical protein
MLYNHKFSKYFPNWLPAIVEVGGVCVCVDRSLQGRTKSSSDFFFGVCVVVLGVKTGL